MTVTMLYISVCVALCVIRVISSSVESQNQVFLETLNAKQLNNTRKAELEILFFTRCAKVGSEAMVQLLDVLAPHNKINVDHSGLHVVAPRTLSKAIQHERVKFISQLPPRSVYVEHTNWINFRRFKVGRPIYMNLVRDPVERVISWYFYVRGSYKNAIFFRLNPNEPIMPAAWFKKDFNECVRSGDPECQYIPNVVLDSHGNHKRQSLFFCGHSRACIPFDSAEAIQKAKHNVETHYAVVGTWEETNVTLAVLEAYIPAFFTNATYHYQQHQRRIRNRNRNRRKPFIAPDVRAMIRRNFTHEYDFYYFCRQRLFKQYIALKLPKLPKLPHNN